MRDLTAVMTMHERPVLLKQAIRSLRRHYPKLPLLVVADGKMTAACIRMIDEDPRTWLYWFEGADMGNSAMRNLGVSKARTKYVAILEEDFEFTEKTRFDNMVEVLEADPGLALCCGALYYHGQLKWFANSLILDEERACYQTLPIQRPDWKTTPGGVRYFDVGYAFNFFVMRTDAGLEWDAELKVAIEHIDFFIRLKKEGIWRAAFSPASTAVHDCRKPSNRYAKDRSRYIFWERFYQKHGYRHGINHAELRVYDLVNRRSMPYPEYVFFLLKHYHRLVTERSILNQAASGG